MIFSKGRRAQLAWLVATGLLQALLSVALMLGVRWVFDRLSNLPSPAALALFGGIAIVVLAAGALYSNSWQSNLAERIGQSYVQDWRLALFDRLLLTPSRTFGARHRGGITLRFIGDMNAMRRWVSLGLSRLIVTGLVFSSVLGLLAWMAPRVAMAVALPIATGLWISWYLGRPLESKTRLARRSVSRLAAYINERVSALATVQAHGQMAREKSRMRKRLADVVATSVERASHAGSVRGMAEATAMVAFGSALLVGTWDVEHGRSSIGTVAAAMAVIGLLLPHLRELGRIYEYWQGYTVSLGKMRSFMSSGTQLKISRSAPELKLQSKSLSFVDVTVSGALDCFSAHAPQKGILAILGENGAGKSTLLSLVMRIQDPDGGRLIIDGQDLQEVAIDSLRSHVGIVSADQPLLRGSVDFNLRYRCPNASAEHRHDIETLCGIDSLLNQLPGGRFFRLTEGGRNLSTGQRAQVMLARALLGSPYFLLIDEVDQALDPEGEKRFENVLRSHHGLVIWVTQDRTKAESADRIWVLNKGRLVEDRAGRSASVNP